MSGGSSRSHGTPNKPTYLQNRGSELRRRTRQLAFRRCRAALHPAIRLEPKLRSRRIAMPGRWTSIPRFGRLTGARSDLQAASESPGRRSSLSPPNLVALGVIFGLVLGYGGLVANSRNGLLLDLSAAQELVLYSRCLGGLAAAEGHCASSHAPFAEANGPSWQIGNMPRTKKADVVEHLCVHHVGLLVNGFPGMGRAALQLVIRFGAHARALRDTLS